MTTALAVYLLDRLTKLLVVENIGLSQSMPVIDSFFHLTYVRNTGAAFGIFSLAQDSFRVPFFIVTTMAAVALLVYFAWRTRADQYLTLFALALVIGGAFGNLTDRALYGYVIDFIDWHAGGHHWPAFNIADSGITTGLCLLGIEVFLRGRTFGDA